LNCLYLLSKQPHRVCYVMSVLSCVMPGLYPPCAQYFIFKVDMERYRNVRTFIPNYKASHSRSSRLGTCFQRQQSRRETFGRVAWRAGSGCWRDVACLYGHFVVVD
jgi:hypothetical protein